MAAVQFYGKAKAIKAYEDADVPAFGLFSGKQLLFKYTGDSVQEGAELLEGFLSRLDDSSATLTLKIFECETVGDKGKLPVRIKSSTECDGSFNFKLDPEEEYEQKYGGRGSGRLAQVLAGFEERMKRLEEPEDEEEDEEESLGDAIHGAIKEALIGAIRDPGKPNLITSLLGSFGVAIPQTSTVRQVGALHKITPDEEKEIEQRRQAFASNENPPDFTDEATLIRIGSAVETMARHDPLIVDHLEKLAQIANENPKKFRGLVQILETA